MRKARLKNDGEGFYHVTSRCVDRTFRFDDEDKTHIVEQIKRMGRFCGVEIGTYAVMSNHFHILLHVLPPQELADEELLGRVAALYGSVSVTQVSRGVCPLVHGPLVHIVDSTATVVIHCIQPSTFHH